MPPAHLIQRRHVEGLGERHHRHGRLHPQLERYRPAGVLGTDFLFHHSTNETAGIKIAVETSAGGGELQDAVVRVGHTARVVLLITLAPDHLFRGGIRQYLHRTSEHHALEAFGIAEINAGLGISLVLSHTY